MENIHTVIVVGLIKRDEFDNHSFYAFTDLGAARAFVKELYEVYKSKSLEPWNEDEFRGGANGFQEGWLLSNYAQQYECWIYATENVSGMGITSETEELCGWYYSDSETYRDDPNWHICESKVQANIEMCDEFAELRENETINGDVTIKFVERDGHNFITCSTDSYTYLVRTITIPLSHIKVHEETKKECFIVRFKDGKAKVYVDKQEAFKAIMENDLPFDSVEEATMA